ncbi:MAG TPA: MBL fold metallo-hydrolase [Clostridia bacterium]|nr:MBL fold metallo-hydrolase [Clostridia bacterium]
MYDLIQVGEKTCYIDCPAKMGLYLANSGSVYLIDSGNDKEAAKKALRHIEGNGWNLAGIINTHSNADHIGGNAFLQQKTGCKIISTGLENTFTKYPMLEPSFLYGGYPCKALRNKFLMATSSAPTDDVETYLPEGLDYLRLRGHFFDMIGIKTPDDVYFLADCVFSQAIINKYHLAFIYDVAAFLQTLDMLEALNGRLYIPAHAEATEDIKPLAQLNRNKVYEIADRLLQICHTPACFEDILKAVFDTYSLTMDFNQYVLVGSTVRSYLSYLYDKGSLMTEFSENRLLWRSTGV